MELADSRLRLDEPAPHVARLTLDNPAKRNALDHGILDAIAAILPTLEDVRCLLITAVGPVFSAGYDIGILPGSPGFADEAEALVAHPFTTAIEALEAFPYPAVAALNGHAIGAPRTRELFLRGRNVDVVTAHSWGLVNEVVPSGVLAQAAIDYAAEVAANAPLSLAGNKRVLRELLAAQGALAPETERELIALREACFASEDFSEGVRAFGEKRAPQWRGR